MIEEFSRCSEILSLNLISVHTLAFSDEMLGNKGKPQTAKPPFETAGTLLVSLKKEEKSNFPTQHPVVLVTVKWRDNRTE